MKLYCSAIWMLFFKLFVNIFAENSQYLFTNTSQYSETNLGKSNRKEN